MTAAQCTKRPPIYVYTAVCFCAMAPAPESQLLWVNKDVKSYRQSRKAPAAEASIINSHSQQQARIARIIASQRALREGSAAKAVVGWKKRDASCVTQLPIVMPAGWSPVCSKICASVYVADRVQGRGIGRSRYCCLSILRALHRASRLL
jgi:hypothetical protein